MTNVVLLKKQNNLLEIVFNRKDRKNAITNAMYETITGALNDANDDPLIRCVLISGEGAVFSAGNDVKEFISVPPLDQDAPVFRMLRALSANEKILVAAVNGLAIGVGMTMLLHCDYVVSSDDATFQLPFINLAIVPEAASSLLLPRLIGHQRTMELLLLGEPVDAKRAMAYGWVNKVVEADAVLPTARDFASRILEKPPNALRLIKRLVKSETSSVAARMAEESVALAAQVASAEGQEAIGALIEKRRPNFAS